MKAHPPAMRERAVALHADGLDAHDVARKLKIGISTAYRWIDPEYAERQRQTSRKIKERYAGKCDTCGCSTNGSNGPGTAASLCHACHSKSLIVLTADQERYAVRRYVKDRVGMPTISAELGCSETAVESALRRRGVSTRPHARGSWTRLPVDELVARYEAGESMSALARAYGVCDVSITYQLKGAGVPIRGHAEAMRLHRERAA